MQSDPTLFGSAQFYLMSRMLGHDLVRQSLSFSELSISFLCSLDSYSDYVGSPRFTEELFSFSNVYAPSVCSSSADSKTESFFFRRSSSSYSVFIRCCPFSRDGRIHPILLQLRALRLSTLLDSGHPPSLNQSSLSPPLAFSRFSSVILAFS